MPDSCPTVPPQSPVVGPLTGSPECAQVLLDRFDAWPQLSSTIALADVSTALYGLNISLAIICLRHTWNRRSSFVSKGRLWGSCLYICIMSAVASVGVVQQHKSTVGNIRSAFVNPLIFPMGNEVLLKLSPNVFVYSQPLALPLSIWGADAILVSEFMSRIGSSDFDYNVNQSCDV